MFFTQTGPGGQNKKENFYELPNQGVEVYTIVSMDLSLYFYDDIDDGRGNAYNRSHSRHNWPDY